MSIKQQQSQMLSAIFSLAPLPESSGHSANKTSAAGLSIYQRSLLANAGRALAITFATVHSFIGEIGFSQLVKAYLQKHLKTQFDWGELGDNFADFIQQQTLPNNDILAAIAALDYACHHTERAENVEKNLASLSLLNEIDAYQLRFNFSAGFKVIKLDYPADLIITDITRAHENSHSGELTLGGIAELLSRYKKGQYFLLIWRPQFQAQYQQITQQEYQWLALWQADFLANNIANTIESTIENPTINQPLSIGAALDKTTSDTFSIIDWLPTAIEQQLVSSISTLTSN